MGILMAEPGCFGRRLRAKRDELGLTLAVLAERTGMSLNAIAKIEAGHSQYPTWETVGKLCRELSVTPDYFYDAGEFNPITPPADPPPRAMGKRK